MKRINLTAARKQLDELKRFQGVRDSIAFVTAAVEPSGAISANVHKGLPKDGKYNRITFNSLRDLLEYPGINDQTSLLLDDMTISADLYLPADLILWFCQPEEIARFAQLAEKGDQAAWLTGYVELLQSLQKEQFPIPDEMADNPALNDLLQNHSRFTIEELVERYQDRRWFQG